MKELRQEYLEKPEIVKDSRNYLLKDVSEEVAAYLEKTINGEKDSQ